MASSLTELLVQLTQHAAPLAHTESLEDFKQQARGVCRDVQFSPQQLSAVRGQLQALDGSSWQQLADDGMVAADVAKTLNALMRYGSVIQASSAAAAYSWLVRAPSAPVHVLLDTLTLTGCLQRVKECAFAAGSSSKAGKGSRGAAKASQQQSQAAAADDDDELDAPDGASARAGAGAASAADMDTALCLCVEVLQNLAVACKQASLRSDKEALQAALEGCAELLGCSKAIKPPAGARALGLCTTGTVSSGAYSLLGALFSPQHGCMSTMAAAVLPRLTPLIVGGGVPAAGKRTTAEANADRNAALDFVRGAFRQHPEIQDAVATLARHLCLRAPDKADSRAAAIKAAAELVVELPQWEQEQFVGFVFTLSRTKQLGLRTLSVGLANNLLMNLPEPFKRSTFAAAAATMPGQADIATGEADAAITATPAPTRAARSCRGPAVPAGCVVAPWSVVALATLLHRCSDKSAVVRGRALADLAEVVDCFAALLAQDPASEQHQVAEAFVEGLGAAAALQLPQASKQPPPRHGKGKRARAEDGSDGEDSEEAEEADAGAEGQAGSGAEGEAEEEPVDGAAGEEGEPGPAAVARQRALRQNNGTGSLVAFMPAQLSADLNPVMSLVHRRCGDAKAAVRRGALQLLEALLVMRASWQAYPRQLPGSADLALLEAATTDPLVSVRKAALVALSTLLELFPAEPRLCTAWVASALPLVRDVEASIQDCLSDWAAALLFDKAAEAAKAKPSSKKAPAARAAAEDDMDWQDAVGGAAAGNTGSGASAAALHELRPLLAAVSGVGSAAGACLGKLCAGMAAKKKLKAGAVARGLEALIAGFPAGSPAALGAWTVLREVAAQDPSAPCWQFLQARWTAVKQRAARQGAAPEAESEDAGVTDEAASLLLVISHTTAGFPKEQAEELATELLQHILSFQLPPAAAGAHVTALFRLTEAAGTKAGPGPRASGVGSPEVWSKQVYAAVQDNLRRYIDARSASHVELQQGRSAAASASDIALDQVSCVAVFTVGQVALLRAARPPSSLTLLLQTLTAHRFLPGPAAGPSQVSSSQPAPSQQAVEGASAASLQPQDSQQPAADALAAGAAAVSSGAGGGRPVPACVQAHAWISLGKVCLVDEGLAKKVVPLFVQELGRSPFPVVRNNIMVALSDMLIQYTALVDAHMPRLAGCIRDRHELVRRQALALLANLLMKDYVKWRGPLFHRFLLALVDPSPAVRQLAEYLLRDVLAVKAPLLAYNHFVEAIFVLNGCTAGLHGARLGANLGGGGGGFTAAASLGQKEAEDGDDAMTEPQDGAKQQGEGMASVAAPAQFTLKGKQYRGSRDLIYAALLRSMSPEHKFNSAAKLCGEVFAGVADGLLPLSECEEVLRDALCLMASKEIKVSPSRLAATEDEDLPSGSQLAGAASGGSATAAEAAAKARGKLVSALMKRHLVEQVVPVLVELRRLLAEARHPLLCELMHCFAVLLKEYKGEVEDILVADKQLAKEILYDIKQAELTKQQQQRAQAAAGQAGAPTPAAASAALQAAGHVSASGAAAGATSSRAAAHAGVRHSPPPAGVLPGTPVAAEVLKTAERQRRLRQQQQQGAGEMPPPSPRPPTGSHTPASLAGLQTPATAAGTGTRHRLSTSSLAALKTPATHKTPGTAGLLRRTAAKAAAAAGAGRAAADAAAAAGVGGIMVSPAPLTISKTGPRSRLREGGAAADENRAPGSGTGAAGAAGPSRAARLLQKGGSPSASQTTIPLPSPFKPTPQRQWNIPQHVATGGKQQQADAATTEPQQQQTRGRQAGRAAAKAQKSEALEPAAGPSTRTGGSSRRAAAAAAAAGDQPPAARPARGAASRRAGAAAEDVSASDDDDAVPAGAAEAKAAAARSGADRRGTRAQATATATAEPAGATAGGRKRRTKG